MPSVFIVLYSLTRINIRITECFLCSIQVHILHVLIINEFDPGVFIFSGQLSVQFQENEQRPSRLFQCSNASGGFKAEEIVDFVQVIQLHF